MRGLVRHGWRHSRHVPVVEIVAAAGSSVKVADAGSGAYLLVERSFSVGDAVVIDFAAKTVTVNGMDACADVALESTFFALTPGAHTFTFAGATAHTVRWFERWV